MFLNPLYNAQKAALSGIETQSIRMQVISENLANANATSTGPHLDPYRRRVTVFGFDPKSGTVRVKEVKFDMSEFHKESRPGDPAADEKGFVKITNVNPLIEVSDMRQADHSFYTCLKAYEAAVDMDRKIIDVLK